MHGGRGQLGIGDAIGGDRDPLASGLWLSSGRKSVVIPMSW